MNIKFKISAISLLFSLFLLPGKAQNFSNVNLSKKFSILDNRFFLKFPAESINNGRDSSNENYTFIDVYFQNIVIHFFARNIYKVGSDKLFTQLFREPLIFLESKKFLTNGDELQPQALMITPLVHDTVLGSVLINSLLVKTKDNAVMEIKVKISQRDFPKKEMVEKLSEQIFQTITNGSRLVNLQARIEKRSVPGTEKSFIFKLPANYVLEDQSDLFNIKYSIIKYNEYDTENKDEFIFNIRKDSYIDAEDFSYHFYEKWGEDMDKVKEKVKGEFLSEKIEWLSFDLFKPDTFLKEQIIRCTQLGKNHVVHISMLSNNQKNIKEMTKIAEAIALD